MRADGPCDLGWEGRVVETGVAWCALTFDDALIRLVREARRNEAATAERPASNEAATAERHAGVGPAPADGRQVGGAGELAIRRIVAGGVTAAAALAEDASLDLDAFLEAAFALKGHPWEEARARRDMRERIRLCRRLADPDAAVPRTGDDLLALWSQATDGEVPVYTESETARFRTAGVPFAHGRNLFEPGPVPSGYETLSPQDIPEAVCAMLAFAREESIPVELRAGAVHFLCGHIHPFRDGNGRTARMLACQMLAGAYSPKTLLAFARGLQEGRAAMSTCMANTVVRHADLQCVVKLFLHELCAAQPPNGAQGNPVATDAPETKPFNDELIVL